MIDNADKNGNRLIDFDEFVNLLIKKAIVGEDREAELREAFKIFDKNGDSFITRSELKSAMKKIGEKMTDADVDDMIRAADLDKDGKVNYEEFVNALASRPVTSSRR